MRAARSTGAGSSRNATHLYRGAVAGRRAGVISKRCVVIASSRTSRRRSSQRTATWVPARILLGDQDRQLEQFHKRRLAEFT